VLGDAELFARYVDAIAAARAAYDPDTLQARIDAWSAQIEDAVAAEQYSEFTFDEHVRNVAGMRAFVAERAAFVDAWLACVRTNPARARDCPDCFDMRVVDRDVVGCRWPRTWSEAMQACDDHGAVLSAPRSADEQRALSTRSFVIGTRTWWLGITDEGHEGTFTDLAGEPVSFTAFAPGEPNGGEDENCVLLNESAEWEDRPCTEAHAAYCARE
jgi:hypothetical protein